MVNVHVVLKVPSLFPLKMEREHNCPSPMISPDNKVVASYGIMKKVKSAYHTKYGRPQPCIYSQYISSVREHIAQIHRNVTVYAHSHRLGNYQLGHILGGKYDIVLSEDCCSSDTHSSRPVECTLEQLSTLITQHSLSYLY